MCQGNPCSHLGPNTNIQGIDQRRILTSWGYCQQKNLEHGQCYRSHNPVSSTDKFQGKKRKHLQENNLQGKQMEEKTRLEDVESKLFTMCES